MSSSKSKNRSDLSDAKKISNGKDTTVLNSLESDKLRLVNEYMRLQDLIDDYTKQVYDKCCEIEAINIKIEEEKKRLKRSSKF